MSVAIHRAAINSSLKRAQSLRLEERVGLRVAIERQRKEGLSVSESVPNLREARARGPTAANPPRASLCAFGLDVRLRGVRAVTFSREVDELPESIGRDILPPK